MVRFGAVLTDLQEHSSVVAPLLLGSILHGPNGSARIVETEAYGGADDAASHCYKGLTSRTEPMFGPAGVLYVYLIYGMYNCANVVTGPDGDGQAVLIRAVEPIEVTEAMKEARPKAKRAVDIANGPGKLCQALGIERTHDGLDLGAESSPIRLELGEALDESSIITTTRIGITKAVDTPWRFYIADNPWVSKTAGAK